MDTANQSTPILNLTVPLAVVGTVVIFMFAGVASYFTTQLTQADALSETKESLTKDITNMASVAASQRTEDLQRVSRLEEAVDTIKATNIQTQNLVKEESQNTRETIGEMRAILYQQVIPYISN